MIPLVVSDVRHGLGWPVLRLSPSSKRCVVSGVVEKGWWIGVLVRGVGGVDRVVLVGKGSGKRDKGTNVEGVMLVLVVEKRAAGVVWCGGGEYQLEIGSAQEGSRSADESQRGSPGA
jgi:hypothetical protein